ncbi:MAG TPA: hypothetical protein VFZ04_21015 [Longimicrobiales bacterium]
MKQWVKHGRGAVLTALAWAVIWAPVAVLVGLLVDADGSMDEMWVAIGAYPGFICGLLFSALLWIAERHRRIDELSLLRVAGWGTVAGLLVSLLPLAVAEPTGAWGLPRWLLAVVIIASITLLSAASAVGSAVLFRYAARKQMFALAGGR